MRGLGRYSVVAVDTEAVADTFAVEVGSLAADNLLGDNPEEDNPGAGTLGEDNLEVGSLHIQDKMVTSNKNPSSPMKFLIFKTPVHLPAFARVSEAQKRTSKLEIWITKAWEKCSDYTNCSSGDTNPFPVC